MVSIVSDLAKSNLEKLINATIEQSRYICCFTCITDDFEKERENLIAKKETWEEYAIVATRKGDNIRKDVTHWQKQAKELIGEDTKMKVTCFLGWCPNCKWQYSRGKELESKTKEIRRLVERNFENVGISRDVPDIEYHSSQNYISFESRKLKFEELFNALKDDNNYMIGLQGMGGTGKTTLAKEVGKELKKSKCFNQVIDTTISNTPDMKKIQDDIAGPLGLSLKDFTESERPKKLKDRLTNGENILLILDDVWGDINFEEIGIPFKDDHNNCRILVTTRNMKICQQMECDKTIELHILPEKEGWILFQKYAGLSDNSSKSILDKGRKISKECKGLPIAIAVIARSLKGPRPLEEWDVALKSLQKSMHIHDDEDESWRKVYTCLKYSYDNMKDETAKKLFLLCSLFREDEEISEELLVRLAKGANLIEKIDEDYSYDECRKKVIVAKYKLTDSCLLLNCESGGVKMHDLVREMALLIANKEIVAVNTSKKNEMTMVEKGKNIKYLLCEGKINDLFSSKFNGSKLDILIVYMNDDGIVEVPNSFFENIPGLQVLILSNNQNKKPILSLPQSIKLLTNIKSLYLKHFSLGNSSILGNLQGLETLELVACKMYELPREIGKLVNLKLLKLNYCRFEMSNVFKVIKSCSSLEELHLVTTYDNKIFKDCHLELPNYQRFCIGEHDDWFRAKYPEWFLRNSLDVDNAMEFFSEETLKNLVQKAEILRLRGPIGVWKNLIPDIIFPEDESTSNLMEISLEDNSELTCLIDNNDSLVQESALSRLVTLKLEGMKNLKEICNGPLPSELLKYLETISLDNCNHLQGALFKSKISLCNLKDLSICYCPMLTCLFELSTTQSLLSLEKLSIVSCEQLKSIIRDENKWKDSREEIIDTHNNNKSTISIFPNLTTLLVQRCHLLHFVLPVTQKIPKLEDITIVNCDRLKYLFGRYQHEHEEEDLHQELKDVIFTSPKHVYLHILPNFVDIFKKCDESFISSKKSTSKDETKGKIESKSIKCKVLHWTHKYKNKWRTTKIPFDSKDQLRDSSLSMVNEPNANDVIAQDMRVRLENMSLNDTSKILFTLQNVTELHIERCEKVEVLFCASMLECLPYLGALHIYRCNELKQIIGEDAKNQRKPFFPRLKAVIIRECNKLKCIFPISTSEMVPMLEALLIMEASMLEEVFEGNSDEKVEIPNLKTAGFVELPSLRQKIEFLTVKHCLVRNCPKLYFSSFPQDLQHFSYSITEYFKDMNLEYSIPEALRDLKSEEIRNEEDSAIGTEVEAASFRGSELTSSQNNANQSSLAKIDEDNKHEDIVKESKERVEEEQQIVVGKASSMPISPTDFRLHTTHSPENEEEMAIPSSNLNTEPPITKDVNDGDFQGTSISVVTNSQNTNSTEATDQSIKKILTEITDDLDEDSKTTDIRSQNEMTKAKEDFSIDAKAEVLSGSDFTSSQETKKTCEDGTTSPYEKTIALSTDSESEHGEAQISVPFPVVNIELETTEDVGVGEIQEASPEKLDEITQDSSSGYTVRRELEELVSKKHLGSENLALLSNFLVKHPSLRLADDAMSERYKGFAYTCLAELLKFLQSHSVYDMLGSSHSEFVELLKDLRNCGFNKDWLDDVERLKTVL
ncbi:uncharacterized protein LOC106773397 [Vigna radiata var. radiata]|uniref:Uncharacterized protein LOC106773397 n=1 Tax=Vigna radiata var. radiata TaxID=3916 RepID=A0A1S3VBE0_VIGRR|nr:uncharacterized protein LOC106773397 [Vigna radiata var. radiata]